MERRQEVGSGRLAIVTSSSSNTDGQGVGLGVGGVVLLVDDNADLRLLCALILEDAGWTVLQAGDGATGIALARAQLPEVIVCDLLMPRIDGLTVLAALREDPETADIPVVMITAFDDSETVARCMQAGAHDYLVKTANREELLARCSEALRVSRQHRKLADPERAPRLALRPPTEQDST